jgi:hypothetical protein
MPFHKTFLVLGDSVVESKMLLFPRIIIMQAALMHSKFHIWFVLRLKVDYKNQIITIICDAVLINQVA